MSERFFAFGKLPSVGDFFRLGAPQGFVSAWDAWLQNTMISAQSALGARWDALYMSMPIWRFSLSPGLAGPDKVIGVLMPSVDRVGRRFPLTLMAPLMTPGAAELDHFGAGTLFSGLEDLALSALQSDMTRDDLDAHLARMAPPQAVAGTDAPVQHAVPVMAEIGAGGALPDPDLSRSVAETTRPSVWSALVGDAPRLMICDGLPQGADAQALFDLGAPCWRDV